MSAEQPDVPSTRRYLVLAFKLSVSVILLVLLFSRIDVAELWRTARHASIAWLLGALTIYSVNLLASTWRWHLLLDAQDVHLPRRRLLGSVLIANFFSNFLPGSLGADVIRISETARPARSKTLATTVVLVDRGLGLMGLVLVAAVGSTAAGSLHRAAPPILPIWLWASFLLAAAASAPAVLAPDGFGRLLRPLTVFHPEWVGDRIETITSVLARFRERPSALAGCFGGALFVQASLVVFYFAVSYALHLNVALWDLAVIVPLSFVVQMLPLSVNGFGVREAAFSVYFARIGQPLESALLVSLVPQAIIIVCSLLGAAVYVSRRHP